jgi:hypothetical protein
MTALLASGPSNITFAVTTGTRGMLDRAVVPLASFTSNQAVNIMYRNMTALQIWADANYSTYRHRLGVIWQAGRITAVDTTNALLHVARNQPIPAEQYGYWFWTNTLAGSADMAVGIEYLSYQDGAPTVFPMEVHAYTLIPEPLVATGMLAAVAALLRRETHVSRSLRQRPPGLTQPDYRGNTPAAAASRRGKRAPATITNHAR